MRNGTSCGVVRPMRTPCRISTAGWGLGRLWSSSRGVPSSKSVAARELTLNLSRYHRTAAERDPEHRTAHGYLTPGCWLMALGRAGFCEAAIHPDFAVLDQAFPEHYAAVVTAVHGCGQT